MGKIFNLLGACAIVGSFFAFTACDDEDENNGNENENSSESKIEFQADTFRIPAKVNLMEYHKYEFQAADKDAILNSLFEQSAKLSKYGNFILDRDKKPFNLNETKLEDVVSEASKANGKWYFVGSKEDYINEIRFDSVKTTFSIYPFLSLDSMGVIQAPETFISVDYEF